METDLSPREGKYLFPTMFFAAGMVGPRSKNNTDAQREAARRRGGAEAVRDHADLCR